ncbi:KxYKxGKxW signal peptide domain-containing protein [Furfurilactobacillus milii]|uniref:Gram-positive cocci surface proteins LPxTG domain-containing protein n=1 Tax=Furfurilactobacillus rossiae TaxID=231049 RepID=A0A7C9IU14_9LACO|nr:KxYKxGKxW signal peptide domain-containing protein [Furfurilactobacillus milii]MYV05956.1 hypothetical protein [Furfurilactobacillus milii]
MLKSKFQHMGEREHYKMYKAGKTWLFASIIAMSLGTVLATTGQSAKADAETKPATEVPTSTNASTAGDASSATLSSSSVAPASNQSQSTSAAGSVKTAEPSADQTVKNASAAISLQTPASATPTDQTNESSLTTKASQPASIQTKEAASDNVSLAPASAARSGADSTNSSSAASDGKSAASSADPSTSTSTQMNATSTANTVASQSTTAVSKLLGSSTQSQGTINSSSVASVNAKQLVAGAVITETADSAVTISLPAGGATQSDIEAAKKAIAATHVTKAMIIAKDDATDVGYANGVAAAKANFAQGMENVYENDIIGWLKLGDDFDPSSLDFSDLQKNTDGYVHSTDASDKTAKARIDTWVDAQLAKIDWATISNSDLYGGDNSWTANQTAPTTEEQNGYLDTVKAYLRGHLVSEAYYLWLLQASNNSDNSKYFGLQGKLDDFQTLRTQMETADEPGSLTGSQADFYKLGFESALDGIVGHPQNPSNPQTVAVIAQKIFGNSNAYSPTGYGDSLLANIAKDYGQQNMDAANYQLGSRNGVNKTTFLPPVDQLLQSNALPNAGANALEKEIFKTAFINYYASWQNVVAQAFTAATEDALSGKSEVLDNSISPKDLLTYIDQRMPAEYASQTNTDSSNNQKNLYQAMYLVARSYLSGKHATVASALTGDGNTAIPTGLTDQAALSNPKGTQVISPLDLAIYSVLTGHMFKYTVSEKGNPIVSLAYQTSPTTSASADWTDGPAQNNMYQLALNVANQAKTDFLSDVQLAINQGDLSKLASAAAFLPNATSQGGLSNSQYAYYKQNSYVYYKVFSALYHSFFTDKDGNSTNVIAKAIADADTYVKQSGDSHNGQPISQSLADAKKDNPDLTATANGSDIKLNADVTYTAPYSEDSTGTPAETVTVLKDKAASKQGDSTSTITSTELSTDNQDNAKKVIQNAIDYAYVHEEAMAIPAYEAGYAAVQRNLNVTPTSEKPALGNPSSDTYQFENKSTVTDILTPVLTTTNPDGTTIWTVHYSNADGTNTLVTITRGADTANPSQGKLTSLQMVVTNDSATLGDSGAQTTGSTSVSYPSVQLNDDVTNDGKKQTTVSVSANTDGTLNYTFVRDALNTVETKLSADGKTTTSDGTSSGKLYQAGWDYRKSFISQMTLVQQAADTNFKNDKVTEDNNKLTEDQTYAGFFQSTDKDGKIVHNSTIQLQPITDVNGAYGTYLKKTITNLDGSKVDITLNVDGSLVYTVYDVNGKVSATNGTGTLGAKDSQVIITNQDATADEEPSQVTIRRTSNDAITVSEIGLQDKMVNDLTVTNTQTAADATVVMGKNVEPSFSSTTIVTPVSALHQGVVLTADPSFGTNGIKSTYEKKNADGSVTNTPDDTNGLTYHGYVTDASSTDNTKDYGTAENSTTTIQYIATNVSNSATKTAMTVNTTQPGPSITISLGKDANGNVQSTTSFDTSKVTADNTGSEIFEWSGVTNLPAGWTHDDTN